MKLSYGNFEQATLQYKASGGKRQITESPEVRPQQTHSRAKSTLAHLELRH